MTQAINFQKQPPQSLRRFREFVFVRDSAIKLLLRLFSQLQEYLNSSWLSETEIGSTLTIRQVHAPQNIIQQLNNLKNNLKFQPNRKLELISRANNGSVIVRLNSALISISEEVASRITIALMGVANNESSN